MRFLDRDVTEAARQHAIAAWPQESCGGVTEAGYIPFVNRSAKPEMGFDCNAEMEPYILDGTLLALIHSHPMPDASAAPSPHDIAQQLVMDIPWGIILSGDGAALPPFFWGEQLEPPPLEGRDFRYGPSGTDGKGDCAALVRDWYRLERGIRLPEFQREDGCWKRGEDLYRRNMETAGFSRVVIPNTTEPEIGDIALMEIRAPEPNHAVIYAGRGLILHHLQNRLSRIEPLSRWREHITDWYRHGEV